MNKILHRVAVAFALALIAAAFVVVIAGCDRTAVPLVPPSTTTGPVPVPSVIVTTVAPLTVGPVRP